MEKNLDYHMILQAIASYLVWAKDFFWKVKKKDFSIWLIPDGHHIYTGTLKALWYSLLKNSETLVLIWEWAVSNRITVLCNFWEFFMGKKRSKSHEVLNILEKSELVDVVAHKFDWIDSELPFLRIISDYKNLVFMEIWADISKVKTINLLKKIQEHAHLLFVSDLNTDKEMQVCKKLDSQILNLDFVSKRKDLFLIELFLTLSNKLNKKVNLAWYLNTGDISTDKKSTTGFGCLLS